MKKQLISAIFACSFFVSAMAQGDPAVGFAGPAVASIAIGSKTKIRFDVTNDDFVSNGVIPAGGYQFIVSLPSAGQYLASPLSVAALTQVSGPAFNNFTYDVASKVFTGDLAAAQIPGDVASFEIEVEGVVLTTGPIKSVVEVVPLLFGVITSDNLLSTSNNSLTPGLTITALLSNPLYTFAGNSVNCSNELKWNTTAISRAVSFDVEKSENGATFRTLQTFATNSTSNYSYTDNSINAGTQYYRLKFTDVSGTVSYSNVIRLSNNCNLPKVSIYPNPVLVYQEATILLQNFAAKATGVIYDASGRQMGVIKLQNGTNRFNAIRYDAGTYTIKVNDEEGNASVLRLIFKR